MRSDLRKTTCPFCTLGCEIGINFDKGRFWHTYPNTGINQGRLCPRGNIATRYLDYDRRLSYPRKDNKDTTWSVAFAEINQALKKCKPEELAIVFDKNLTTEEFQLIENLAKSLGIENFAAAYLEPEYYFNHLLEGVKRASLDDLVNAELFFLIGDVFNQSPVVAKSVLEGRYRKRENRIIALDSMNTYTMAFADVPLWCEPGTEPLIIAALNSLVDKKTKTGNIAKHCELAGVAQDKVEALAAAWDKPNSGVIINVAAAGKNTEPLLHCVLPALLTMTAPGNKKYLPLAESLSFVGTKDFTEIYALIRKKKLKMLLSFGDYFPFFYQALFPELSKLELIVATSTLKRVNVNLPIIILPVPSNLEKDGDIVTSFGPRPVRRLADPVSGAKPIKEIIDSLISELGLQLKLAKPKSRPPMIPINKLEEMAEKFVNQARSQQKAQKTFRLLGEKIAFDFLGLLNQPKIKINPNLAKTFNVKEGDLLCLQTKSTRLEIPCQITNQVLHQYTAISAEIPKIRNLFEIDLESRDNICRILPTEVKLWKRE